MATASTTSTTARVGSIVDGYRMSMSGRDPEESVGWPIIQQSWHRVAFVHWPMAADVLAPLLPNDLEPDVLDGYAWVAITPFEVRRFRLLGLPSPSLCHFVETNLRTYVRHRDGGDGLWFLSIDVTSTLNAILGRVIGAPYHTSEMSVDGDQVIRYRCRRTGDGAAHDIRIRPGDPIAPDSLVDHLTGRWRAYTRVAGQTVAVPVSHRPWPLRAAQLLSLDETLFAHAGLPAPAPTPLVHYSDGLDASFGALRLA